ncbi:MAG: polyamine aminopropyltransferase [Balneolaceae bacterium]|nr:polyamine aminopropyltransferase [Balneolaceae bacterium]
MAAQFNEYYNGKTGLTVGVEEILFSEQTEFQKVEVLKTDTWGNLMTIDGMVMLSEKDEFVYHEMLTHVAMFTHPQPEWILIIGGGDGGTAREVLRHATVQQVDLVEIDEAVIRASKQHFPGVGAWSDPRLNIIVENGITFVHDVKRKYDVVIIDGSDPVGPAKGLFEQDFIGACRDILSEDGVLAAQTESPWVASYHASIQNVFSGLKSLYTVSRMYLAYIPLYPAGMWSFCLASKGGEPLNQDTINRVEQGLGSFGDQLKYYNKDIHIGSFALPNFVEEIIT